MGLFKKEEIYKVIREPGKKPRIIPINMDAMESKIKDNTIDKQIKAYKKKEHNRKVDARRKKLKKLGKNAKKVWDYLGETELAKQNNKKHKNNDFW